MPWGKALWGVSEALSVQEAREGKESLRLEGRRKEGRRPEQVMDMRFTIQTGRDTPARQMTTCFSERAACSVHSSPSLGWDWPGMPKLGEGPLLPPPGNPIFQ